MFEKVLVTGGNGLLGTKMVGLLLSEGRRPISASLEPDATNRFLGEFPYFEVDITDGKEVIELFRRTQPEAVVHTAAFTAVDACETQKELSWQVNVVGTANVARACKEMGARLVHISTEYVFDGERGPYTEEDMPHPISHYGLTKLESEKAVRECCSNWAIARTTVLFGHSPNVRPSFVAWLVDKLSKGERVRVVDDQVGSPTLADNLAQMLLALLDSNCRDVYNTVGDSIIDRYTFSLAVADLFGLDPKLIDRIKTRELNQPAPRPLKAGLLMDKFKRDFPGVQVLTVEQALLELKRQMGA